MSKVSVIIPVYNTQKYLAQCLDSVLGQTYRDIEIICVDDASPDNSIRIMENYAAKNPNIKILRHEKNRGLFAARVTGLKAMTGDYFAFLDSDDTVTPDFTRSLMNRAIKNNCDIVASDFVEVRNDGVYYPNRQLQQCDFVLKGDEVLDTLMRQEGMDFGWHVVWNKVYSKRVLEGTLNFLEKTAEERNFCMCEDIYFSVIFFSKAKRFENVHGEFYKYNKINNGLTKNGNDIEYEIRMINDIAFSFSNVSSYLKETAMLQKYEKNLKNWKALLGWCRERSAKCSHNADFNEALDKFADKDARQEKKAICDFFGQHYVKTEKFPLQEIKAAIANEKCKCVSFDVFDTLLVRPFFDPNDLFTYMEPEVTKITGAVTNIEFKQIRMNALRFAREEKERSDVTLDEIYDAMGKMCVVFKPYLDEIKKLELETELRFIYSRKSVVELVEFVRYLGKKIVCTSDMYLPSNFIGKLLEKCGIAGLYGIFVSCEHFVSKNDGKLFKVVESETGFSSEEFVHIGDNFATDVKKANAAGWNAFYIPKTTDCIRNVVPNNYYGHMVGKTYLDKNYYDLCSNSVPFGVFLGTRCMLAMQANKLFDNPFVPIDRRSDFNANPAMLGYFALGPFLLAFGTYILELAKLNKYDQINFVSRDGYLPMEAFKIISGIKEFDVKTNYVYTSRKAIAAMWLADKSTLYSFIKQNYNQDCLSPKDFMELFSSVMAEENIEDARSVFEDNGIVFDETFSSIQDMFKFANVFLENFYDEKVVQSFLASLEKYYEKDFEGHTLYVDIGYSCRFESTARRIFGFNVDSCYVHPHGDSNVTFFRAMESGGNVYNFYDYLPIVRGPIREIMLSKLTPSCIGFKKDGKALVPMFEEFNHNPASDYVIDTLQKSALKFVADFCNVFGKDYDRLPWLKMYACLPLENFFHHGTNYDRNIFAKFPIDDNDVVLGKSLLMNKWNESFAVANAKSFNRNVRKTKTIKNKYLRAIIKLPGKAKKGMAFYKKNGLRKTVKKTFLVMKKFVGR